MTASYETCRASIEGYGNVVQSVKGQDLENDGDGSSRAPNQLQVYRGRIVNDDDVVPHDRPDPDEGQRVLAGRES